MFVRCEKCGRFISKEDVNIKEIPHHLSVDQQILCGRCFDKVGCKGTRNSYSGEYDCGYKTWLDCGECMFGNHGGRKDPRSPKYAI